MMIVKHQKRNMWLTHHFYIGIKRDGNSQGRRRRKSYLRRRRRILRHGRLLSRGRPLSKLRLRQRRCLSSSNKLQHMSIWSQLLLKMSIMCMIRRRSRPLSGKRWWCSSSSRKGQSKRLKHKHKLKLRLWHRHRHRLKRRHKLRNHRWWITHQ